LRFDTSLLVSAKRFLDVVSVGDRDTLLSVAADVSIVFAPLSLPIDDALLRELPEVTHIVSNTTGAPHVNRAALAERGIKLICLSGDDSFMTTVTPTAELTIGLMIAACRMLPRAIESVKLGQWNRFEHGTPAMLSRMRLGLVGFGRLGQMVDRIASAIGMETRHYDPMSPSSMPSLADLASESEIISVHASLNPTSYRSVDASTFNAMPDGSVFVNTARGEIVDEDDLLAALRSGKLRSAALDVLTSEPPPGSGSGVGWHPLVQYARQNDNLILTPHIGGSTQDAWFATQKRTLELLEISLRAGLGQCET
jgi:D-3-phosphoglycerate dehydrogenase